MIRFRIAVLPAVLAVLLALAPRADAHDGPPYPIFVDEPLAGWTISIWTDPDVGTGTFYYYVEAPDGRSVDELEIETVSEPADGTSGEVRSTSESADADQPYQHVGTLEFATRGIWPTRFVVRVGQGDAEPLGELVYDLNVTPPGLGWFDMLWFAFPFLAIGGLWVRALLAQRAYDRAQDAEDETTPREA